MYEHDPNRDRPSIRQQVEARSGAGIAAGILAAALIVLLAFTFWPNGDNRTGTSVTQNAPREERAPTTTPPSNKPAPTTPAPNTTPK